MRVYIAAPYPEIEAARTLLKAVEHAGYLVTSRWLKEGFEDLSAENALKDLEDVSSADVLVAYNPAAYGNSGTGGRHVEFGYAVALGKVLVLVGPMTHIFHFLPQVVQVEDHLQLMGVLRGLAVPA